VFKVVEQVNAEAQVVFPAPLGPAMIQHVFTAFRFNYEVRE